MLRYFVAGQPVSVNAAYKAVKPRARRDGKKARRRALTAAALAWQHAVYYETLHALGPARDIVFIKPLVSYRFTGTRCDADNLIKLAQDSISRALGQGDAHFSIGGASVERGGTPGCWIEIQEGLQSEVSA